MAEEIKHFDSGTDASGEPIQTSGGTGNGLRKPKKAIVRSARDLATVAAMTAVLFAAQFALSGVQGVEIVTVLFLSFCVAFGVRRGMAVATVFSLLRNFIYGFYLNVAILYLVYFNLFAIVFGLTGRWIKPLPVYAKIIVLAVSATVMTCCFTLLDDLLTPLVLGYTAKSARVYFYASLPVMGIQAVCAAVSVAVLWYPLSRALAAVKR